MPNAAPLGDVAGEPAPLARVIVLAGPSGSGKTRLAERLRLPVVPLDDYYKDATDPTMPRNGGHLDWESPASWDRAAAIAALRAICAVGSVEVPTYSYSLNRPGLLADAILIHNRRATTFARRLRRDLDHRRKPIRDIVRIGVQKVRAEAVILRELQAAGCTPMSARAAESRLRALIAAT